MSFSGTSAIAWTKPSCFSDEMMVPRRWLSWPMTAPWNSSGNCTSTLMIGSRMVGLAAA